MAFVVTTTDLTGVTGSFVSGSSTAPTLATSGRMAAPPTRFTLSHVATA